jgi:hypothetical protein
MATGLITLRIGPSGRAGPGILLGGRLVLTAAHVVCPGGRPLATVQVRDESGLVAARVAWHRWDDEVDIAVLEIIGSGWVAPVRPVHTRETGLEHAPDHPRRPQEQTPTPFSAIKHAPPDVGVKDLRPLRGRPTGRSLTPTPQPGAPKTCRRRRKEDHNPRKGA